MSCRSARAKIQSKQGCRVSLKVTNVDPELAGV